MNLHPLAERGTAVNSQRGRIFLAGTEGLRSWWDSLRNALRHVQDIMKSYTQSRSSWRLALLTSVILFASSSSEAAPWTQGVSMPTARRFHASVVGGDGKIYVIGGEGTGGPTASVERFDESTQQWEAMAPLPLALVWPAAAKDKNGDIWVFGGGLNQFGSQESDAVFKYEIRSNHWSTASPMPETRQDAQAVTDSVGYIYTVGGQSGVATGNIVRNLVRRFDPNTLSWSNLPPTQAEHTTHAVMIDSSDIIYAIGHGSPALTVERFDPSHPELGWTFLSPMPSPRQIQGTMGRDGLLYLAGGWFGAYTPLVHRYNPGLDSWEAYDSLINGRNNMGVVTGVSGRIYSTGGDGPNSTTTPLSDVEYNDPYELVGLTILQPPQDQTVGLGTDVTFAVTATGTSQLSYQWRFNGTNINGAIAPALPVPNASFDKAGVYSVVVSNASGAETNSAVLSLLTLKMYAGLTLAGPLGATYRVDYVPAVGNTNNWLNLTNVTLTSSPQLWFDTDSPDYPKRFYRAILLP